MMERSTKAKICKTCKITPLTPEEENSDQQRCYWCEMETHKKLKESLGDLIPDDFEIPDPEDYGRTPDEVLAGRPSENSYDSPLNTFQRGEQNERIGFQKNPEAGFEDGSKAFLKAMGLDVDNPAPFSLIEAKGNEGTKLTFEISASIDPSWRKIIQDILNQNLIQIVKLLTFGTKHDAIPDEINRAMRGPRPEDGQSGFPG